MQLKIEKLVYGGDGLARIPGSQPGSGKSVFVPFVLDGERVEAVPVEEKPGFARARLESVLESSPDRVEPACPYFRRCGGCQYQQAAYRRQVAIKAAVVRETLARTGKLELACELQIHSSAEWHYRNRTRLQVRTTPRFALGYFRFRSHELLPISECPISSPFINRAIGSLAASEGRGLPGEMREIEFFANHQDDALLAAAYCAPGTPRRAARQLAECLEQLVPGLSGVTVFVAGRQPGAEPSQLASLGRARLLYQTRQHGYQVSAASFFQVNRFLIDELVTIVTRGLSGNLALDVYAGVGLFSAILAAKFQEVVAVEASHAAVEDLRQNVPREVRAVRSTAEQYLAGFSRPRPDVVIVDPPRAGLGKRVVEELIRVGAAHIAYVSCDPATLARDLAIFVDAGYRIGEAHAIDLFPQTYHIESVFHLLR